MLCYFDAYNRGEKHRLQRWGSQLPRDFHVCGYVAVPLLSDAIFFMRHFSHGFKNPRLFAFGTASFRRIPLIKTIVFLKSFIEKPYEKDAVE